MLEEIQAIGEVLERFGDLGLTAFVWYLIVEHVIGNVVLLVFIVTAYKFLRYLVTRCAASSDRQHNATVFMKETERLLRSRKKYSGETMDTEYTSGRANTLKVIEELVASENASRERIPG